MINIAALIAAKMVQRRKATWSFHRNRTVYRMSCTKAISTIFALVSFKSSGLTLPYDGSSGESRPYWQPLCYQNGQGTMKYIRQIVFTCLVIGMAAMDGQGQESSYGEDYQSEYERRIQLSHINGHYIPRDVNDAMVRLENIVDQHGQRRFKVQPEHDAVTLIHFSFGRWMIHNWGFYEGSRLSHYLKGIGITYPDDMAATLMRCFHRRLNGKPLQLKQLAEHYAKLRKKEVQERLLQGEKIENPTKERN